MFCTLTTEDLQRVFYWLSFLAVAEADAQAIRMQLHRIVTVALLERP